MSTNNDLSHPYRENLAAYALGALDTGEIPALEQHLQTCESCQDELDAFQEVDDGLLAALPPRQPSPELRRRLQESLSPRQESASSKRKWSLGQIALGAAWVLLLGITLFSVFQVQTLQRQQATLARQINNGQTALAMLAYPSTRTLPLSGGNIAGNLLVDPDRNVAALIVWNLPALPADQTYQVWLNDPQGNRTSGGTFSSEPNQPFTTVSIFAPGAFSKYKGIGVTVEPAGGSTAPTGRNIFKVDL
jgi:anti-sigma-K factor RskA